MPKIGLFGAAFLDLRSHLHPMTRSPQRVQPALNTCDENAQYVSRAIPPLMNSVRIKKLDQYRSSLDLARLLQM
ncbi:MAG: hypothetical protein ACTS2F_30960 [Thainema sp.]